MRTLETLKALYQSTRALGLTLELDALLDEVLRCAQGLVGCENCALLLVDHERGRLELRRAFGFGERLHDLIGLTLRLDQGLCGWVAAHRQALRVGDVRADERYVDGLPGARSNMAVPLILHNEVVAVLNAESVRPDAFSEEHEWLCTVLGTQAALAIEASRSRERTEQRLRERNALYRISQLAAAARDLPEVFEGMLEAAAEVMPAGSLALLLVEPGSHTLRLRAARGEDAGGAAEIQLDQGLLARCAESGRVEVVQDGPADQKAESACSAIAVPLLAEGRVAGVLGASSRRPHSYRADDVRTLELIAHEAAAVLRAAQLHEELRRRAITDPLTGLYNRRHFVSELEEHLRRVRRYEGRLAVVALDLDGFKSVNDRHGHALGDRALQTVAAVMREWVRDSDVVARVGGDEFAALLLEADRAEASRVVERLRRSVEGFPVETASTTLRVTLSAGIALYPDDGLDNEVLINKADAAMYEAKRLGRNRVVLAGESSGR